MAERRVADSVRKLAEPLCDELGLFLWDVKYEKEGANLYLRVYIDKDGGIGISDCEALHRPLDKLLDEQDPVPGSYIFEVCSPGLGRRLERPEHFEVCIGDPVRIRYIRPKDGEREFSGILKGYDGESIAVDRGDHEEKVALSETAYVKLDDDSDWEKDLEE